MPAKFHWSATGAALLSIRGKIDEQFDAPPIRQGVERVVINLGAVTGISSVGVRALETYLRSLAPTRVTLIHVSAPIALQLNLVSALRALVSVESARLPFVCPGCGSERVHSVPWRATAHLRFAPVCACGQTMQLDGMAEHYLPTRDPTHPARVAGR
jgi:anti-anti-sigma regulatory factor